MTNYAIGKARVGYWVFDNDAPWYEKNFRHAPPEDRFPRRRDAERAIIKRGGKIVDWREDE